MTLTRAAQIHARAFPDAPWTPEDIARLTEAPGFLVHAPDGFAVGRAAAGESELMTIAIDPAARRQGQARALLAAFYDAARARGAETAFLEVARDNHAARALYRTDGWADIGLRRGYYARPGAPPVDAIVMTRSLTGK